MPSPEASTPRLPAPVSSPSSSARPQPAAAPPPARLGRGSSSVVARAAAFEAPPLQIELPLRPPRTVAVAERPIAWGRVFAAVALMSALMGGGIARLAYQPSGRPGARDIEARVEARVEMRAIEPAGSATAAPPAELHPDGPDLARAPGAIEPRRASAPPIRALLADRDYGAAAVALTGADLARDPELALARLHLELVTARFDDACGALVLLAPQRPAAHAAFRIALAYARGDRRALARALAPDALDGIDRAGAGELVQLAPLAIALRHAGLRERVVHALDRQPEPERRALPHQLARALLGELAGSPYPEVDAVAQAIGAERARDWRAAAAAWREAAALSRDGPALAVEQLGLARALHRDGDLGGAAAACRDLLEPRELQPHWGVAAADCHAWMIEAALDRRERGAALRLADELASLRASAGPRDRALRRVRALLAP